MKTIGIFEAKTPFPALGRQVAATRAAVLVQKWGRPLVMIAPITSDIGQNRPDILTAWKEWSAKSGKSEPDFPDVWDLREEGKANPLVG